MSTEAPFMFNEHDQQLAQLYLDYEQATNAQPYDHAARVKAFEAWRAFLFAPPLGKEAHEPI